MDDLYTALRINKWCPMCGAAPRESCTVISGDPERGQRPGDARFCADPDCPSATSREDDFHTIGLALNRAEHSRRCEGWYACTCIVGEANAALARLARGPSRV